MKFVKKLTEQEQKALEHMRESLRLSMTRKRAHSLLLSTDGYCLGKISDILGVCLISFSSWLEAWKKDGLAGFYAKKRTGRPRTLSLLEEKEVIELVASHPRKLKTVLADIMDRFVQKMSLKTFLLIGKKSGLKWKLHLQTLKQKKDEALTLNRLK